MIEGRTEAPSEPSREAQGRESFRLGGLTVTVGYDTDSVPLPHAAAKIVARVAIKN